MEFRRLSKSLLGLLVVVLLVPGILLAATGKVRGTVTDKETGEPLAGANVLIENSSMGAASNMNGEYIIMGVPTGKINLVVTYMGFKTTTISDIIVNTGLTTYRDIELERVVLAGEEVVIVAERPLIDKSETNEIHYLRSEDIALLPIRGVAQVLNTMAGVIDDSGVHVRGGRSDEMAYYVDGVNATTIVDGNMAVEVISNAIEEVQLQTGGFTAEFGGKMSGITNTTIKTGTPKYNITAEVISDDFWALKNDAGSYQILGLDKVYSYGYNDYVLTAGGPIVPSMKNLRFFVAGQVYNRLSDATWFEGFHQDTVAAYGAWSTSDGTRVRDTLDLYIDVPPGRLPGGGSAGMHFNGNVLLDLRSFRVKVGGTYANSTSQPQAQEPRSLIITPLRGAKTQHDQGSAYLNLTHTVDPTMFYTLSASFFRRNNETYDLINGKDFESWGNPTVNPALVDTSLTRSYYLSFDDAIRIAYPNTPPLVYSKNEGQKMSVKLDVTKQFGIRHEVKAGAEFQQSTLRYFNFDARNMAIRLSDIAKNPDLYTEYDVYTGLFPRMIGYDWLGNKVNEDMMVATKQAVAEETVINIRNKPMTPVYLGAYIQDRIEMRDLIINAGLRLDYITSGFYSWNDLSALTMGPGQTVAEENWGDERTYTYLSPRLGFSFPVTDQAVFHAQYGKYVQAPDPFQVWGMRGYTNFTNFLYGGGYAANLPNPNLKPEKTTSYEFGFQMMFGVNASLDVTAFYKDTRDLLTLRVITPTVSDYRAPYFVMNGDFGTVKGFTATFNLRRISRIQTQVNYTYSHAQGTGSTPGSHFDIAWQESSPVFPKVIAGLDYDIRHKGTVVLDARSLPEDGPVLAGMHPLGNIGLNMMFEFHSGSPYTRIPSGSAFSEFYGYNAPVPLEAPNASTLPWFYQLNGKLDKTFTVGPVRLNAYLWVINILNTKSITDGYRQTGRPDSDGFLESELGKTYAKTRGQDWVNWYNGMITCSGVCGYQEPRQIRLGLKLEI